MLTRLFALLLALAALPAAAAPALWKVADPDTTIWLYGTVHLLPKGEPGLQGAAKTAFDTSDTLALEVLLPSDPQVAARAMFRRGLSSNLPPVVDRVPTGKRPALTAALKSAAIPDVVLPSMETWLVALTLSTAQLAKMQLDAGEGVEARLRAAARGKRLVGLETLDEQLALFDGLPEADQRELLTATVDELPAMQAEVGQMLDAWRKGDVDRLAAEMNEGLDATPGLRKTLLSDRNARWAQWIKTRMATPGSVFVAVGAGHLAGPDSVQAMLAKHGLKAERVK
ncbi:MAG: TraB/GumN family protein [Alphaproteobacteria bacterium]|nr:TraB/GumN family protein [Alphaproteobacteria bacterium]